MSKSTKAVIYTRFSDRPNAATSESCEYQRELCEKWCNDNDHEVVGYFEDKAISGKTPIEDRPGLGQAICAMHRDYLLVVLNWDRIARDRMVHIAVEGFIIGIGGNMYSVMENATTQDESPESELLRGIKVLLSGYSRQIGAMRTSASMLSHQGRGRVMSAKLPYGFKFDPESPKRTNKHGVEVPTLMIENKTEQKILKRIMSLNDDKIGVRTIAKILTEEKHKPRGQVWYATSIGRIIERETS